MKCNLCPRKCNADREDGSFGFCGMPSQIKVAKWGLFNFEEPCISLNKGSGAIFFSGCNLACVFCQNYEISALKNGKTITTKELADIFKQLEDIGAENINLVTPMHFATSIVEAIKIYRPKIPIIYNTNAYETESVIEYVAPYVDIFLPDLKYYSPQLSLKFSNAKNYFEVAIKAIKKMYELKTNKFAPNGKMLEGIIIRHMILPLCTEDSIKVLETIKQYFPQAKVSLMAQYTPMFKASSFKQINRGITKREYEKVFNKYIELGLDGYVQDLSSASSCFTPIFID